LHLHVKIREARLAEANSIRCYTQPGASAACVGVLRAPAWKLLYERQGSYNPDSHTNRVIYGDQEEARYGFETIDPYQPHGQNGVRARAATFFPNQEAGGGGAL